MAARRGYEATARLLLELGAVSTCSPRAVIDDLERLSASSDDELGAVDHYGASPLHWAAMYGAADTVSLLLDRGLAIDDENDFGETPLALAALAPGHDMPAQTDRAAVIELLRRRGAKVAEMLLDAGADVDWPSPRGGITPMYATVIEADLDKAQLLIARGADVNHNITIWQKDSLLHTVANRPEIPVAGAVAMIELLVGSGADVNALDDAGHTPLQVAVHDECAEVLRRRAGV